MDNLARNAMLARQAGMSYGKWKALQPPGNQPDPKQNQNMRICAYCGKPFPKRHGHKYCDEWCQYEARYERMKQRKLKNLTEREGEKNGILEIQSNR